MSPSRVVVAGAGVLGASVALALARRGVKVTLIDGTPIYAGASWVAAGMLAPAFESLFDNRPEHFELLSRARVMWPAFADDYGLTIERSGAMAVSHEPEKVEAWVDGFAALGVATEMFSPADVSRRSPWLARGLISLGVDDDWRIAPQRSLRALRTECTWMGLRNGARARVVGFKDGRVELNAGAAIEADALVIAAGVESVGLVPVAPELSVLRSIKGQILLFPHSTLTGRIVRFAGGYLCTGENGILLGATMEEAWTKPGFDEQGEAYLRGLAKRYAPVLADEWGQGAFGFRASTPDGLPLVGPSATPGVWLATGARRNGWLLAPMVAETIAREMTGGPGEPAFAPGRFSAPLARIGSGS